MKTLTSLLCLLYLCNAHSQVGEIILVKDSAIDVLVKAQVNPSNQISGYRIQLDFSLSKKEMNKLRIEFSKKFPSTTTYLLYNSAYYVLKIGDFTDEGEARQFMVEKLQEYKGSFLTKDIVFSFNGNY